MSRFLVTTADTRTWRPDEPMLFLGQWCLRYRQRSEAEGLDIVFCEPFGVTPRAKMRGDRAVRHHLDTLLEELTSALNAHHGVQKSRRYWHILLGHWLFRAVSTLYNRYFSLVRALDTHQVIGSAVYAADNYRLATTDTESALRACNDDLWNHVVYARILRHLEFSPVEVLPFPQDAPAYFRVPVVQSAAGSGLNKQAVLNASQMVLRHFARPRDAVIINSYLPKMTEAQLNLSLGQVPAFWQSPPLRPVAPAPDRGGFRLNMRDGDAFERFLRAALSDMLPTCYLEGYSSLLAQADALPWPKTPRFIFTSNNFDTDEIFKTWTAGKVETGTPYFVGQHGNYGVSPYVEADFDVPEAVTPDRFISWGLSSPDHPKVVPGFIFKAAGRDLKRARPDDGSLLLIEQFLPTRKMHWDSDWEQAVYQDEQFRFTATLPPSIQGALNVRLHAQFKRTEWSDRQRWADRFPHVAIDDGALSIRALTARARLVVHSYDSTGILETLYYNVPTLAFWYGGLSHLHEAVKPHYERLVAAGIVHTTPESAALWVAKHWDDINAWWTSPELQDARRDFCDIFAHMTPRPVASLKSMLLSKGAP